MAVDWQRYLDKTRPLNLLELMDKEVLVHLLNGFSLAIGAGVSVLFAASKPVREESLDRCDALGNWEEARKVYRPFCREYRSLKAYDEKCLKFDKQVAVKYWKDEWTGPMLYRCHMHLWDMTYPLIVNGCRLGVLFAGQIVVKGKVDWKAVLSDEEIPVAWETLEPGSMQQEDDVLDRFHRGTAEPTSSRLLDTLAEMPEAELPDVESLIHVWTDFGAFGKMMESLLGGLYTLTENKEREELLGQVGAELIQHTTSAEKWGNALSGVVAGFHSTVGVGPIEVYSREGSRYVQKISSGGAIAREQARRVPVRVCVDLPVEDLAEVDGLRNAEEVRACLGVGRGVSLYRSDLRGLEQRSISTILVIHSGLDTVRKREFGKAFCRRVGLRAALSELLFQVVADRRSFDERVRRASHSSKTPLQSALSDIELTEDLSLRASGADFLACFTRVKERIEESSAEVSEMIAPSVRPRQSVDLRDLIRRLAEELDALAAKKSCTMRLELPDAPLRCRISEPDIRVALRNLLDNAIKYSFDGREVRVQMELVPGPTARVVFQNFGVGIPEDRLKTIRELGERGGVVDAKAEKEGRFRLGSGLGLTIAIQDVEAHGGSLDVESRAGASDPRYPHLGYVTTVTVTLPVVEG